MNTLNVSNVDIKTQISSKESPKKQLFTGTIRKIMRQEKDNENKKVFNEDVKKKQIEKINKIIERSN
jgi:hypothetical protein